MAQSKHRVFVLNPSALISYPHIKGNVHVQNVQTIVG